MLINVKMPTIVRILTFISMIIVGILTFISMIIVDILTFISIQYQQEKSLFFRILVFMSR